ncbi:hypothetical protein CCUS01_16289 [Colletotrichum cuscutae]|uniref:Uncharacterized protein n=1 Tax=Colletotrichum cuscutae TaxID=1209917 RepID=A0AAI9Y6H4_9PEZI|nr:hypothetical protein CCUS01_16289 [Colletotrichum cuscutae]
MHLNPLVQGLQSAASTWPLWTGIVLPSTRMWSPPTRKGCRPSLLDSQIAGTRRVLWLASSRPLPKLHCPSQQLPGQPGQALLSVSFKPAERPAEGFVR